MKTWSYGINSLYRTASIDLQTGPWWAFVLERAVEWCCDLAPAIPLPKAKMKLRDPEDIELNGGHPWTTWKEWYGDLSQLFHGFVHMPVFNFCQRRIRCREENEISYADAVKNLEQARLAFRELNRKLRLASFETSVDFQDE
jgi:hypothetical protein